MAFLSRSNQHQECQMLIPPFRGNAGAITPSTNKAGVTTKAGGQRQPSDPHRSIRVIA